MTSSFQRLLLPLGQDVDQERVLSPATVLASWFGASIQIVCGDPALVSDHQRLAAGLGVPVEPVVELDGLTVEGLAAHANANEQTLIIAEASEFGLELAAGSSRPVFLVPGRPANQSDSDGLGSAERSMVRRLPLGPLAVQITGSDDDLDALALAAVVAPVLEESIRLVVDGDGSDDACSDKVRSGEVRSDHVCSHRAREQYAAAAEQRLVAMGLEVGIDALGTDERHPLVLLGRTRACTAVIIPRSRIDEPGLIEAARAGGVNVMVAATPDPDSGRPAPFALDLSRPIARPSEGAEVSELDRGECLSKLGRHTLARIGYVDDGWPTVVPVNYRYDGPDIFIRSLGGGKLRAAEREDVVCLELDGYDEQLRTGWSIIVHGKIEVIHDAATLRQAWDEDPTPWIASDRWHWLRLVPFSIAGRMVEPGAPGEPAI